MIEGQGKWTIHNSRAAPAIDPVVGSIHHRSGPAVNSRDGPDPDQIHIPSGEKVVVEESYRRAMAYAAVPACCSVGGITMMEMNVNVNGGRSVSERVGSRYLEASANESGPFDQSRPSPAPTGPQFDRAAAAAGLGAWTRSIVGGGNRGRDGASTSSKTLARDPQRARLRRLRLLCPSPGARGPEHAHIMRHSP